METQQVEVDEPRIVRDAVVLVLRVVAIREATVHEVRVALGVNGAVPVLLLDEHDLAEGVERVRERAAAGDARVVVAAAPGRHRRVHVAVRRVEVELALDDRRQFLAGVHRVRGLRRVAAVPRRLQLVVGRARHAVRAPVAVDRREVREVVVRTVPEPELVDHRARVVVLPLVAALLRRGVGAERKALVAVTPTRLVVSHEDVLHPAVPHLAPVGSIVFAVARAVRTPHDAARDVLPRRDVVRHHGQDVREAAAERVDEPLEARVAHAVRARDVARAAVRAERVLHEVGVAERRRGVRLRPVHRRGVEERTRRRVRHEHERTRRAVAVVGVVRHAHETRTLRLRPAAEADLRHAPAVRADVRHEGLSLHVEAHFHAAARRCARAAARDVERRGAVRHGRVRTRRAERLALRVVGREPESAALRERLPRLAAVAAEREVIPDGEVGRQAELERLARRRRNHSKRTVRERQRAVARVDAGGGVGEHAVRALRTRLERDRRKLLLEDAEAREVERAVLRVRAARQGEARERGAARRARDEVFRKALLREPPFEVVDVRHLHGERLAVGVEELGRERRRGCALRLGGVVDVVAVDPQRHRVEGAGDAHGLRREDLHARLRTRAAIDKPHHAGTEHPPIGRAFKMRDGVLGLHAPARRVGHRQDRLVVVVRAVRPHNLVRPRIGGRIRPYDSTRHRHDGKHAKKLLHIVSLSFLILAMANSIAKTDSPCCARAAIRTRSRKDCRRRQRRRRRRSRTRGSPPVPSLGRASAATRRLSCGEEQDGSPPSTRHP